MLKKFWHCRRAQDKGSNLKALSEGHHQIPFCHKKFQYLEEKRWFWVLARVKGHRLKLAWTWSKHMWIAFSAKCHQFSCKRHDAVLVRVQAGSEKAGEPGYPWVLQENKWLQHLEVFVTPCLAAHCHPSAERWGACADLEGNMVPTAQLLSFRVWSLSTNPLCHRAGES